MVRKDLPEEMTFDLKLEWQKEAILRHSENRVLKTKGTPSAKGLRKKHTWNI